MKTPLPSFDGVIHLPGLGGYEGARVGPVFNGRKPDRYPAAILEAASDADVVAGVKLATAQGWSVSVRAGGHSWAAWSVRDDALLIDLSRMRSMEMGERYEDHAVARVCPAVQGGQELTPFLAEHGYQFTGGHCTTVGIGGFVLQGGQGWNSRLWGWGCENLLAIDVVTADGVLRHASETENSELLWAARGSGPGFFGVVTRMHLKVYPRPKAMAHTTFVFPVEVFDELMTWAHAILPTLDRRVEPVIAGTAAPFPDGTPAPGPYMVMHTTCMADSLEECRALLAPLNECPVLDKAQVRDVCVPTSIVEEGPFMDAQNPRGLRYHTDCLWTDASAEQLVPRLRAMYETLPTENSFCIWYGWAPNKPLRDMAFSMEGNVYIAVYAMNEHSDDDARVCTWVSERMEQLAPLGKGLYLGDSDFTRRSAKFMTDANYAQLEALRATWDPDRVFVGYLAAPGVILNKNPSEQP
jgi:FAD/FMN-containing dehydrogenase